MKKILYIVGGVAVFFVIALFGLLWYTLSKMELDANRSKTASARAARWGKDPNGKDIPIDTSNEEAVNKLLDNINDKKNEKET